MSDENYIHPNFNPTDKDAYIKVVNKVRSLAKHLPEVIYVTQEEYDFLEDAVHPTMKGKGHQVYGKEIRIYE